MGKVLRGGVTYNKWGGPVRPLLFVDSPVVLPQSWARPLSTRGSKGDRAFELNENSHL